MWLKQSNHIGIPLKTGSLFMQVIGYDHIAVFPIQLFSGMLQQMLGFHCKAANNLI